MVANPLSPLLQVSSVVDRVLAVSAGRAPGLANFVLSFAPVPAR